jgi:hypothetical protein
MAKEITGKEQYDQISELISAVEEQGTTGSAKERAANLKKTLDNQKELLKVFEGGIPANLGAADQKAIMQAVQGAGIEITDKDEDRSIETERFLLDVAFKAKKERLTEAREKARQDKDLTKQAGLHMQGLWMDATNSITSGILDLKEWVAGATDIGNMKNALSQDFQMLTMGFSELMNIPGMKTMVAGIKYIAGWIGRSLAPIIHAWYKGLVTDRIKRKVAKEAGTYHNIFQRMGLFFKKSKKIEDLAEAKPTSSAVKMKRMVAGDIYPPKDSKQQIFDFKEKPLESGGKDSTLTKIGNSFKKMGTHLNKRLIPLKKSFNNFFTEKDGRGFTKATKAFRKGQAAYKIGLRKMTRGFKDFGKNLKRSAKHLAARALGFIVNIGIFLAGMVMLIAGFIMANLPIIALVALIVLLVIGLVILFKKLSESWETIKVKMAMAMDRLKLVGTKIINWFKDAGADIGYRIRQLIAKIKDGLVWIINAALEAFAKMMPDGPLGRRAKKKIRAFKMEEGAASAKVDADRSAQLAARELRDKQLEADFEAKYAERGKQLEDAAKKDADRKAEKDADRKTEVNTTAVVTTNEASSNLYTQGTGQTDFATLQAIQARG